MVSAKETALGIAAVLGSDQGPNPLPITFRGQSLQEAADLVQLVIAECGDAGIPLDKLELDPEFFEVLVGRLELPLRPDVRLQGCVKFYRSGR